MVFNLPMLCARNAYEKVEKHIHMGSTADLHGYGKPLATAAENSIISPHPAILVTRSNKP
jgi:hypothetical protein